MKHLMDLGALGVKPEARTVGGMLEVLYGRDASGDPSRELYLMYRGLALNDSDQLRIASAGLRYDITVVANGVVGVEFVKTLGHYHPKAPLTSLTYAEVYQVLGGRAHYLLQKEESGVLADVVLVEAGEGDIVLVPPGYGHVTINPGGKRLVMANWVADGFKSDYAPVRSRGGGAYFELSGGRFVENRNYGAVPPLRFASPKDLGRFGLERGKDMYRLVGDLCKLDFLKNPQSHLDLFEGLP